MKLPATKTLLPLLLLALFFGCEQPETTYPVIKDMTVSVYAPGKLVDDEAYLLHSPTNGILLSWIAEEGDTVRGGEMIASVEGENSELNRENAKIRMKEIQQNLMKGSSFRRELDLAIDNAHLKYQDDSINFSRQERLWKQEVGTQREYEARKLAMESSYRQYQSALEKRKFQLAQLRSEYKTSKNLLSIAENQSLDFNIYSKIDGILSSQLVKEGEIVIPQQPIGRIAGLGSLHLELEIDEVDIVKINKGQAVVISLDAYPDQVFTGIVTFIYTQKDPKAQSYRIQVDFEERPAKLYEGMTAEANIIFEEKKDALLIPQSYLISENRVLSAKGDTLQLKIGASDLEYCEVLEGLDVNTEIQRPSL